MPQEPQPWAGVLLQLTLLLSALPAQYLLSRWTGGDSSQRHTATQRSFGEEEDHYQTVQEALTVELMMHHNEHGYFAVSSDRRSPRPGYVLHRVGQVVLETKNQMVGVIVGWDAGLRAPPEAKDTPHYRILFSGPDASSILIGYIPQQNLKLLLSFEPEIATLEHYFSHFNGDKFVMQEWLQELYPED
ncbi:hypothetical protein DNTS_009124 [Danionella cerebrum]|uniref:Hemimethylated DNA-binding domain-containing protein n=1 Tax=Danionella cerebrum TaxID=2873325 RepID=A0A553QAR0_9TELE|nr:hypothetical protein DNTS_009124 [Danionella translucida]